MSFRLNNMESIVDLTNWSQIEWVEMCVESEEMLRVSVEELSLALDK